MFYQFVSFLFLFLQNRNGHYGNVHFDNMRIERKILIYELL